MYPLKRMGLYVRKSYHSTDIHLQDMYEALLKIKKNIRCALLKKSLKKKKKSLCFMHFTLPLLLDTKWSLRYS